MKHRTPPKSPYYDTATPGQCRQCGGEILNKKGELNKRARWHSKCVKEYKLLHWPQVTRRAVYKRDKGICAHCGKQAKRGQRWDMDHIKPLVESNGDLSYWKLPNLQTLCPSCHIQKTSKEATSRATSRRMNRGL